MKQFIFFILFPDSFVSHIKVIRWVFNYGVGGGGHFHLTIVGSIWPAGVNPSVVSMLEMHWGTGINITVKIAGQPLTAAVNVIDCTADWPNS